MTDRLRQLAETSETALAIELRDLLARSPDWHFVGCIPRANMRAIFERRAAWNDDLRNTMRGNIDGYPAFLENLRASVSDTVCGYDAEPDGLDALVFVDEAHTAILGILRWKMKPPDNRDWLATSEC